MLKLELQESAAVAWIFTAFAFIARMGLTTLTLAHLFNSLVRVSRRVVYTCHSRQLTASRFAPLLH